MKFKSTINLAILILLAIALVACSSSANSTASITNGGASGQGSGLSQVNKLLVGTLKLENTNNALTADDAKQILPLWQAYMSLSSSDTAAEVEVTALLNQIQSTMTSDQINAIDSMNLTNQDMLDLMTTLGVSGMPQGTPNPQATPGFDMPAGGFQSENPPSNSGSPSGGSSSGTTRNFPSGGMVFQGGPGGDAGSAAGLGGVPLTQGTQDPSMQATAQARFSTQADRVNGMLLNVLISKLEALANQ